MTHVLARFLGWATSFNNLTDISSFSTGVLSLTGE